MNKQNHVKSNLFIRNIAVMLIITILLSIGSTIAYAKDTDTVITENPIETSNILNDVGTIVNSGKIRVLGTENNLYCVFEDDAAAIEDIKVKSATILSALTAEYGLDPLTDENWEKYRDAMYMLIDSENKPEYYTESNIEYRALRAFFDIYENKDKNAQIVECAMKVSGSPFSRSADNETIEELALLLPCTESLAQQYMGMGANTRASFNVSAAISYAEKYATSRNTPTYYSFSNGDCANFVSQILENAGVSQIQYNDVAKGWWHKRESGFLGIGYKHTHSQSWSMADTFARYQGVRYSTTSNLSFSANLTNGCFIVADFENDGDWDHCGFVTQSDSYKGSYGYYDYKVAQHTSDYLGWASLDKNNWEKIGGDGGKYARVRN